MDGRVVRLGFSLAKARQEFCEVAGPELVVELVHEDAVPTRGAGVGGARQREHERRVGEAADGAGLNGGTADLLERQLPKQFAEALDVLVEERRERLGRAVATGEAGAAGADDRVDVGIGNPSADDGADGVHVVADDVACRQAMASGEGPLREQVTGTIVTGGAGVGHREQGDGE